jgi:formate dehydrogenase major subunit
MARLMPSLEHWHTGALSRRAALLDELEPQALACLCPADLRRIGAQPGDSLPTFFSTFRSIL